MQFIQSMELRNSYLCISEVFAITVCSWVFKGLLTSLCGQLNIVEVSVVKSRHNSEGVGLGDWYRTAKSWRSQADCDCRCVAQQRSVGIATLVQMLVALIDFACLLRACDWWQVSVTVISDSDFRVCNILLLALLLALRSPSIVQQWHERYPLSFVVLALWLNGFSVVSLGDFIYCTLGEYFPCEIGEFQFLDPEGRFQKATVVVVVVVVVVISSLKALLICSGVRRNFVYTFVLTFPTFYRLRFVT